MSKAVRIAGSIRLPAEATARSASIAESTSRQRHGYRQRAMQIVRGRITAWMKAGKQFPRRTHQQNIAGGFFFALKNREVRMASSHEINGVKKSRSRLLKNRPLTESFIGVDCCSTVPTGPTGRNLGWWVFFWLNGERQHASANGLPTVGTAKPNGR